MDSGGRVFDYKVDHQQKQHSKEDLYGTSRKVSDLDRKMRSIDVGFQTGNHTASDNSTEKLSIYTSTRFSQNKSSSVDLQFYQPTKAIAKGQYPTKIVTKSARDAQNLKVLMNKKAINQKYSEISKLDLNKARRQSPRAAVSQERNQFLQERDSIASFKEAQLAKQSSRVDLDNTLATSRSNIYASLDSRANSIPKNAVDGNMVTYSKKLKVLENCPADRMEGISKSLQKL